LCCTTPSDVVWHLPTHDRIDPNWCRTTTEGVERHKEHVSCE
jgi:hypothetical protein